MFRSHPPRTPRSAAVAALATFGLVLSATGCKKEEPVAAPAVAADKAPEAAPAAAPPAEEPKRQVNPNAEPAAPAAAPTPQAMPGAATPTEAAAPTGPQHAAMHDPSQATEKAPDMFKVKLHTTKGDIVIEAHKDWSPSGADRLYNLVKIGYFQDIAFFRAVKDFMVQFGIHGDPTVNAVWRASTVNDDPPGKQSNQRGMVTFAKTGAPNSRSVQLFINYKDNAMLDGMGFTPVGKVIEGMDVVDKINTEYGEGAPRGQGPNQMRIQSEGNKYLKADFPRMDYILSATIVK
jgi:peptidyl-prolyl cis-trans isomerase A (cyclophilin A)